MELEGQVDGVGEKGLEWEVVVIKFEIQSLLE